MSTRRTKSRTVTDQPSLPARIDRAIYRLQNTHGLPLHSLGDGSDPDVVLRDCADDHVQMRRVLCELREAVLEQVGKDQTDRLRRALSDAVKASVGVEALKCASIGTERRRNGGVRPEAVSLDDGSPECWPSHAWISQERLQR